MKAVQYRQHALLAPLMELGGIEHLYRSLPVAVSNGDDLAVSLLLRLFLSLSTHSQRQQHRSQFLQSIADCANQARGMGFHRVENRLRQVLNSSILNNETILTGGGKEEIPPFNDFAPTVDLDYGPVKPNSTKLTSRWNVLMKKALNVILNEKKSASVEIESYLDCEENFDDFHVKFEFSENKSSRYISSAIKNTSSYAIKLNSKKLKTCAIDKVYLHNITTKYFHENYVMKNKPVVLQSTFKVKNSKLRGLLVR
jgi:hypothetical protein